MDVHGMRVFARVAALSNISAAASELEMTPGNVSKRLQTLENSLGVRLFDRNTRMIRITEEGEMLLRSVTRILAEIDEVRETLAESASHPRGTLRVTAPAALSRTIRPGICEFQEKHPNVTIELNLTDRIVDILEEGYDVAIRTGPLPDSQLIAKRLAPDKYFILASPSILSDGAALLPNDLTINASWSATIRSGRFSDGIPTRRALVSGTLSATAPKCWSKLRSTGWHLRISGMKTNDLFRTASSCVCLRITMLPATPRSGASRPPGKSSPRSGWSWTFRAQFRRRQNDSAALVSCAVAAEWNIDSAGARVLGHSRGPLRPLLLSGGRIGHTISVQIGGSHFRDRDNEQTGRCADAEEIMQKPAVSSTETSLEVTAYLPAG